MILLLLIFLPMLAGLLSALWPRGRFALSVAVPAAGLGCCLWLFVTGADLAFVLPGLCSLGLTFRAEGFRALYPAVACFMWLMTGLFGKQYFAGHENTGRYALFTLLTLGSVMGVFLSDDLYTAFVFFEIMSVASYVWVAQEEDRASLRAAGTYLAVALIGGMTTLMGLFLLYREAGTFAYDALNRVRSPRQPLIAWLILTGFAAKAGLFPLHIWLPKAHPVAPAPASALLSGMLTKVGVFGMLIVSSRLMPGSRAFGVPLLLLAVVTMFAGAVMALFSVNLKRTLACSSMSQIGFITFGLATATLLGEEGTLSAMGALLHMLNHSLIKLCLFLCAGAVHMNLHQLKLSDVRGFGRGKPILRVAFLAGALSIAGVPFAGSGYLSKSLLHEGYLEFLSEVAASGASIVPWKALEIIFLVSGGLTFCYMLRLYVCLFHAQPSETVRKAATTGHRALSPLSSAVLLGCAAPLFLLGLTPSLTAEPLALRCLPFFMQPAPAHAIAWFSGENLLGAAESLLIGGAVYLLLARRWLYKNGEYPDRWPAWLDLENSVYRPLISLGVRVSGAVIGFLARVPDSALVLRYLPHGIGRVTAWIAHLPDSSAVLRFFPACLTAVTRLFSELPERVALLLHRCFTPREKRGLPEKTVSRLHELHEGLTGSTLRVIRSVSFGLILLCLGLAATCLYLITR